MRYEALLGPNTNQWWIYDNENDKLIDPPTIVLEVLKCYPSETVEDMDVITNVLEVIANANPDWINDKEYIYDGDLEV